MAGELPLDDGRYLVRSPAERVLVTETEGALPPARRRRRRPRNAVLSVAPVTVAVSVVTVILAAEPFDSATAAEAWLGRLDDSDFTGELLAEAIGTLDRVRVLPTDNSKGRFSISYLNDPEFIRRLNEIAKAKGDTTLTIVCSDDELRQFTIFDG